MRPHPRGLSGYIRLTSFSCQPGMKCGQRVINPREGGWIVAAPKTMFCPGPSPPDGIDSATHCIGHGLTDGCRVGGWHEKHQGFSSVLHCQAERVRSDQKRLNPDLRLYFGENRLISAQIERVLASASGISLASARWPFAPFGVPKGPRVSIPSCQHRADATETCR